LNLLDYVFQQLIVCLLTSQMQYFLLQQRWQYFWSVGWRKAKKRWRAARISVFQLKSSDICSPWQLRYYNWSIAPWQIEKF